MRRLSSRQVAASSMSGLATGYLWRTVSVQRSLIASLVTYRNFPTSDDDKSRQNPQIRREIRKKNFRDKFFSDENLSESVQNILITIGNTSTSHWPGLSHEAHVTCLGQWESRKSTSDLPDKIVWHACAVKPPYCFRVCEVLARGCRTAVRIWRHLDQNKVSTFVIV